MDELVNLDWQEILDRLLKFATSEYARQELMNTGPLASAAEASHRCSQILQLTELPRKSLRPHMQSLDLFSPWHQRLCRNAVLKTLELKDVRHFCSEALALKEICKTAKAPYARQLAQNIMAADEPLSAIDQILTPGGEIRVDASERLHNLNLEKSSLSRQVQMSLDNLVKNFQIEPLLQERFVTTREGRWVIPVKSGMQHGFAGIVHASSQSKQTVFMEPQEVLPLNNRLRQIEIEIEEEIEDLLTELSVYLSSLQSEFAKTKNTLIEADTRLAHAQLAIHLEANACIFAATELQLQDLRHPLLVLNGKATIENSVDLNSVDRILLLSGPNAGGKTVLLKAIGLAAQMARCGLPICAKADSKMPFFKKILVSIGDSQSVDSDLSTFAAHLKKLNQAADESTAETLLLIDEICGSTDPEEGAALARSFINTFLKNQVIGVITSHLGALKRNWPKGEGLINGSLEFDAQSGPTYRFIMGVPGQSLALQTAKRIGVRKNIIDDAFQLLSPDSKKYQTALSEAEELKANLIQMQKNLSEQLKATEALKLKHQEALKKFADEKEILLNKELKKASQKVDELIQFSQAKDVFKKHEELQKIKFDLPQVFKYSESTKAESLTKISSPEEFFEHHPPGTAVHIPSLNRDGIIQGHPNSKGEIQVLSESMRLQLPWRDLKPAKKSQNPTQKTLRTVGHFAFSSADSDRVVDLRGLTSEDALSQLEIQLDTASLHDEDRVKIIHGHGGNTLKKSVRTYLSRSIYVKKWLAGTKETGGDGITWVELK